MEAYGADMNASNTKPPELVADRSPVTLKPVVRPDICTSMICSPPQHHCRDCSHAIYKGDVIISGKFYRWEHSPQFGPLFARNRREDDCNWSPSAKHPVWKQFQRWHDKKFGSNKVI